MLLALKAQHFKIAMWGTQIGQQAWFEAQFQAMCLNKNYQPPAGYDDHIQSERISFEALIQNETLTSETPGDDLMLT